MPETATTICALSALVLMVGIGIRALWPQQIPAERSVAAIRRRADGKSHPQAVDHDHGP